MTSLMSVLYKDYKQDSRGVTSSLHNSTGIHNKKMLTDYKFIVQRY